MFLCISLTSREVTCTCTRKSHIPHGIGHFTIARRVINARQEDTAGYEAAGGCGAHSREAMRWSGRPPLRSKLRRQLAVADGRNSAAARSPFSCKPPASLLDSGLYRRTTPELDYAQGSGWD